MIKLKQAVIVEGKYDKIKLQSILDALIIETGGFDIFSDKERLNMIRSLAKKRGIIIMTDSDAAGFIIRNYLGGSIPKEQITHVYIPDIIGKEKRKEEWSKEGKLGVEGIPKDIILKSLIKAGIQIDENNTDPINDNKIKVVTRIDLYNDGLSGTVGSKKRLDKFKKLVDLPEHISKTALLDVINIMMTYDEYKKAVNKL